MKGCWQNKDNYKKESNKWDWKTFGSKRKQEKMKIAFLIVLPKYHRTKLTIVWYSFKRRMRLIAIKEPMNKNKSLKRMRKFINFNKNSANYKNNSKLSQNKISALCNNWIKYVISIRRQKKGARKWKHTQNWVKQNPSKCKQNTKKQKNISNNLRKTWRVFKSI